MVVTFVLPLGLVIPIVVKNHVMNPGFGSICFVGPDMASTYFFLPLSIVVCAATLLHLGTIAFMIKVYLFFLQRSGLLLIVSTRKRFIFHTYVLH